MANIKIAVLNRSAAVTDAQVQAVVPPLQTQIRRDFAPVWGVDADLAFVPAGVAPATGSWWLVILDDSDQATALGYHDMCLRTATSGSATAGPSRAATRFSRCWSTPPST